MDFTLDLPIYDSILEEFMDLTKFKQGCYELRELAEMCCYTDEVQQYFDEHYLMEALNDPKEKAKLSAKEILGRTKGTTGGLLRAYDNITTAKGNLYHSVFSLGNKLLAGIVKVISFIMNTVALVPKTLLKLANLIGSIPEEVRIKIRGDIKLYITADDIQTLYAASFMKKLKVFINDAEKFSRGKMYTMNKLVGADKVTATKLIETYAFMKTVSFTPTVVNMKNPDNITTYFSNDAKVSFKDSNNKNQKLSYLKALEYMANDINSQKTLLESIKTNLDTKDEIAHDKLKAGAQNALVTAAVNAVANSFTLIGNMAQYIVADIATINKAAKKVLEASKKK